MAQQQHHENPPAESERRLVIPGDTIAEQYRGRAGPNTYMREGTLFATVLGLAEQRGGDWGVIPLGGVYIPRSGDLVISIITELGPSNWLTDINAPYPAPLHASETPWNVDFGETSRFLKAGDAVLAKILFVDETKKTQITMKESNLKKLEGGQIITIDPAKVARVIGRQGSMVQLLTDYTETWLVVGQNGRVWINGEMDKIQNAIDAIRVIEEHAHQSGLTNRVTAFLKERTGKDAPESSQASKQHEADEANERKEEA